MGSWKLKTLRAGFLCYHKHPDRQHDNIEYQDGAYEIANFGNYETGSYGQSEQDTGDDENYLSHMNNIERHKMPVNV
jgi:hypothetical protein